MWCLPDVEHPSLIPMDVPTSPSTPLGPMTRARAKSIEDKVNLLLSESSFSTCETWLLPQTCVLCMSSNQEEGHGIATSIGQDDEDTKREEQEEELQMKLQRADVRPQWMTGHTSQRADVQPPPDNRHIYTRAKSVDNRRPDDRQLLDVRCHLNRAKSERKSGD